MYHTGGWLDYSGCEFIFDHCWLTEYSNTNDAENGYTIKCNLAMECEWSLSGEKIYNGFLKLVIGRANINVMIFNQETLEKGKKIARELQTQIRMYEQPEDIRNTYLLSCFSWEDEKFYHFLGGVPVT